MCEDLQVGNVEPVLDQLQKQWPFLAGYRNQFKQLFDHIQLQLSSKATQNQNLILIMK
jgi:hypothetical protein